MFQDPGIPLQKDENRFSKELLGKSTNIDPMIIPLTIPEPEFVDHCWFPTNLLDIAKAVSSQACLPFKQPSFKFEMSPEAAVENWNILNSFS